jgi:hypothetical protein
VSKIICPKCKAEFTDGLVFMDHLEETERHHPDEGFKLLVQMVNEGKIKVVIT